MTATFSNPAIRERGDLYGDGRLHFELVERLEYSTLAGGLTVAVPKGFITDFASVPRLLWSVFPPMGRYSRAAVIHDWLYSNSKTCSRFLADAIFRDAMKDLGVPMWRRVVMYYAVRICGWKGWVK